jgi:hypothetical protein
MNTGAIGAGVGAALAVVAFPLAALLGAVSVPFHRGHSPETFGHGIAWACRGAFYLAAAAFVAGVLVAWALIYPQLMAMLGLTAAAVALMWWLDRNISANDGGRVL